MDALFNLFEGIQEAIVHTAKAAIAHAKQMITRLNV
jgi:hypothetical protein